MTEILKFVVIGVFSGSIYALASMGVVLTYKTSGVFNFAYGAIAMFCAFTYWQIHVQWNVNTWIALPLILVVVAPAIAVVFEAVFRPLTGQSAEVQIVVSLGMLAALEYLAPILYGDNHILKSIFPTTTFLVGSLHVGWDQLGTLLLAVFLAGGLWVVLRHTRFGTATRAVVDNQDLSSIIGVNGDNVRRGAWILSSVFAALVGILLSPGQGLNSYQLTTVVIYAFAPAVAGLLTSLPIAFGSALGMGIIQSILSRWSSSGTVADIEAAFPYLALFVLLIVLGPWLKELGKWTRPSRSVALVRPRLLDRRRRVDPLVPLGLVGTLGLVLLPLIIRGPNLGVVSQGAIFALLALTLVVLTGWAGQISLAQFSFVGIGAFTVGHLGGAHGQHFLWAAFIGIVISIPIALIVGLVSLRLSGLFLALATMAFALLMDGLVFNRPDVSGGQTGILAAPPQIFGISFASRDRLYELVVVVFIVLAFAAYAVHKGPVGRRLQILRDSPVAASTLGVNLTVTKLITFAVCGAVAALGGAFYGAFYQSITPLDFQFSASLSLLLYVVLGGRVRISGAIIAGFVYGIQALPQIPAEVHKYLPLAIGLGVVGLAQVPEGTVELTVRETRRAMSLLRPRQRRTPPSLVLSSEGASNVA